MEKPTRFGRDELFLSGIKRIKRSLAAVTSPAATALMAGKIREFQRAFVGENRGLLEEIKDHTKTVMAGMNIGDEVNFRRYFGDSPVEVRGTLVDLQDKSGLALEAGLHLGIFDRNDWNRVVGAVDRVNITAKNSLTGFDDYFKFSEKTGQYQVPRALTESTKNLWATQEIVNFANSKTAQVNTRHLRDAAVMALGLGGMAMVAENVVFPLSDKLLEE